MGGSAILWNGISLILLIAWGLLVLPYLFPALIRLQVERDEGAWGKMARDSRVERILNGLADLGFSPLGVQTESLFVQSVQSLALSNASEKTFASLVKLRGKVVFCFQSSFAGGKVLLTASGEFPNINRSNCLVKKLATDDPARLLALHKSLMEEKIAAGWTPVEKYDAGAFVRANRQFYANPAIANFRRLQVLGATVLIAGPLLCFPAMSMISSLGRPKPTLPVALAASPTPSKPRQPDFTPTIFAIPPTWTTTPLPATSTPTLVPPSLTPTVALPTLTPTSVYTGTIHHDLLFVSDDYKIKLWDHLTGRVEIFLDPTTIAAGGGAAFPLAASNPDEAYDRAAFDSDDVSDLGAVISLATGDNRWHALVYLSPESRAMTLIEEINTDWNSWPFIRAQLSPDGDMVAYILNDRKSNEEIGAAGPVYIWQGSSGERSQVGYCSKDLAGWHFCTSTLAWSADSQSVAWDDPTGVWAATVGASEPSLVVSQERSSDQTFFSTLYQVGQWSPSGRYLLVEMRFYEGSAMGVLDTTSGRVEKIPGTDEYTTPGAIPAWMSDDRLFSISQADQYEGHTEHPYGKIWRVEPDGEKMLLEESVFEIPVSPVLYPFGPRQLNSGELAFGLFVSQGYAGNQITPLDDTTPGIYLVNPQDLTVRQVGFLPATPMNKSLRSDIWTPDESGLIAGFWWSEANNSNIHQDFYIPLDGNPAEGLVQILGEYPIVFAWLP